MRDFVSGFAHSAAADGDAERAQELLAAGDALSDDFKAAGTDPGALDQAFQIVKDRQADTVAGPISEEAVQAEYMESMELLQAEGVTEADISAARQFIDDLEVVAPGTKATLQATGSGNDPKLVRLVIQESRRRGYGS
ncbi:hypothetical protein [Fodinicurvata halophila]|uniref:hypothetical protein n=1 Tax=Fodinicurvata halophila TaxID=1419723 RepID=UPI00362B803B